MGLSVDIEVVDEEVWRDRGVFWSSNFCVFPPGSVVDIWRNDGFGFVVFPHEQYGPVEVSAMFRKPGITGAVWAGE